MQDVKIVLVMPQYCEYKVMCQLISPIKNLQNLLDNQRISQECRRLFDDDENKNQQKRNDDSIERRLSVGEKIKSKLQSTNNGSVRISNVKCCVTQFFCDQVSEGKLVCQEFKGEKQEENDSPILVRTKGFFDLHRYDESAIILGENNNQSNERLAEDSPDLSEIKRRDSSNRNQGSSIRCLRDITNSSDFVSNFHKQKNGKLNIAEKENCQKICVSEVKKFGQENENRERYGYVFEKSQIKDVDSVCLGHEHLESYEYAMFQLSKLRQNVQILENATRALQKLKRKGREISFSSGIEFQQSDDKNDEEFIEYFEKNLRSVLCKVDGQNVINTHSISKQDRDEDLDEQSIMKNKKNFQIKRLEFS